MGRFPRQPLARAFSLLEVMVALSILGLALTLILSAQGGLAATNKSAANMGVAINLGRCRMTEIEEKLLKLGYAEVDEIDSSRNCCSDTETPGFSCDWRIEKVILPPPPDTSSGDGGLSFASVLDGGIPGMPGMGTGGAVPTFLSGDGGFPTLDLDAGLAGIGQAMGAPGGGGALGMLSMVFTIIYPSLKPVLEASIRRVTVTVKWNEGFSAREFPLIQYITNPMRAGFAQGSSVDGGAAAGGVTPPGAGGVGLPPAPPAAAGGLR